MGVYHVEITERIDNKVWGESVNFKLETPHTLTELPQFIIDSIALVNGPHVVLKEDHVKLPTSEEEARMMMYLAINYLEKIEDQVLISLDDYKFLEECKAHSKVRDILDGKPTKSTAGN